MSEYLQHFIACLFVFGLVVLLVELVLSARWLPFYFKVGIPVYKRILVVQPGISRIPTAGEVEAALPESGKSAPILVRRIDDNSFAFREKLFYFGIVYSPIMHGYMKCNPTTGKIITRGYLNWYILLLSCCFLISLLALPIGGINIVIPLCLLVLMAYIYSMQKKRFRQVEDAVQKLLARNVDKVGG
jgi:hypothetical protein